MFLVYRGAKISVCKGKNVCLGLNIFRTIIVYMTMHVQRPGFERGKGNEAEEHSEKEKRSKLRNFCKELWDVTKRTTQVLGVAVGMTVLAYGCGGNPKFQGDADNDNVEVIDGENDADVDVPDGADTPDVEVEPNCTEHSEPLEGEVEPLLAKTSTGTAALDGSDSNVSGDSELTVGGAVSVDDISIIGECSSDSDSLVAFGAQGDNLAVLPQYRLDLGESAFSAELPDVDVSVCPPPETDSVPVSMFLSETNLVVKEASIGGVDSRAEFSFVTPLSPVILVNGSESSSPIALDGSGYAVKAIMMSLASPLLLEMAATVYSDTGGEVLTREVDGSVSGVNSKTLRVYQLGSGDSMLPDVAWNSPGVVRVCLRSCTDPTATMEHNLSIDAVITARIADSCGNVYDGFDIDTSTLNIVVNSFSPTRLQPYHAFEVAIVSGSINTMEDGSLELSVTVRRTPPPPATDAGTRVTMDTTVHGELVSRDNDPRTGSKERVPFSVNIVFEDPEAVMDYSVCGCLVPPGI